MGREFETKYSCTEESFTALQRDFSGFSTIEMETTYYDTFDGKFSSRQWTLRRRLENGKSICTLKTPADTHGRKEWEVECGNIMAAAPKLCQLGAPQELMIFSISGLRPLCGAKFTRLAAMLEIPGGKVELALDRGILTGGGRECPLLEVEVELKEGSEEAMLAFSALLAEKYRLTPEKRSKFRRSLGLALGE